MYVGGSKALYQMFFSTPAPLPMGEVVPGLDITAVKIPCVLGSSFICLEIVAVSTAVAVTSAVLDYPINCWFVRAITFGIG